MSTSIGGVPPKGDIMKKKFDWLRGRVSYLNEEGELASFHGEFNWNPETRLVFLRESRRVAIFRDTRLKRLC